MEARDALPTDVLRSEPIAALEVREEPGRGQVVCIELTTADEGSTREARQRIAAALDGPPRRIRQLQSGSPV